MTSDKPKGEFVDVSLDSPRPVPPPMAVVASIVTNKQPSVPNHQTHQVKSGKTKRQNFFHYFRYVVLFLAALSNGLLVLIVSMGVAQQNMVNQTAIDIEYGKAQIHTITTELPSLITTTLDPTITTINPLINEATNTTKQDSQDGKPRRDGPFVWKQTIQQLILNVFNFTFAAVQIFGGPLIDRVGTFKMSMIGQLISAISAVLIPTFAYWGGWPLVSLLRLMLGAGSGFVYPSIYATVEKWTSPEARSAGVAFVQFGSGVGNTLSSPLAGWLCDMDFLGGWPLVFYVNFILVLTWIVAWYFLASETPETHPNISDKELRLLRGNDAVDLRNDKNCNDQDVDANEKFGSKQQIASFEIQEPSKSKSVPENKKVKMEWRLVLSKYPIWAAIYIYSIYCGTNTIIIMSIPNYFKNQLGFSNSENGSKNGLMQLGITCSYLICGGFEWYLRDILGLSKSFIRKFVFVIGATFTGIFIAFIAFVDPSGQKNFIVGLLIVSRVFHGFMETQLAAAVFDMAPDFSGILMGFINGISAISTFVISFGTGVFLEWGKESRESWNQLFIFCGILLWSTAIVYSFFLKFHSIFNINDDDSNTTATLICKPSDKSSPKAAHFKGLLQSPECLKQPNQC